MKRYLSKCGMLRDLALNVDRRISLLFPTLKKSADLVMSKSGITMQVRLSPQGAVIIYGWSCHRREKGWVNKILIE